MSIDLEEFENTLYQECENVFPKIINDLKDENIYSLALYNSGDSWGYLFPTVATYKGLKEVALSYKNDESYQEETIEYLQNDLKWSPCDSPRHESYVDTLPKSKILLQKVADIMEEYWDKDQEEECEKLHNQLVQSCLNVLKVLENNGVFSKLERTSYALNVLNGDQSDEERIERAEFLNPTSVASKYAKEI